jgi:hypothetical protein
MHKKKIIVKQKNEVLTEIKKAYRGNSGIGPLILNLGIGWR